MHSGVYLLFEVYACTLQTLLYICIKLLVLKFLIKSKGDASLRSAHPGSVVDVMLVLSCWYNSIVTIRAGPLIMPMKAIALGSRLVGSVHLCLPVCLCYPSFLRTLDWMKGTVRKSKCRVEEQRVAPVFLLKFILQYTETCSSCSAVTIWSIWWWCGKFWAGESNKYIMHAPHRSTYFPRHGKLTTNNNINSYAQSSPSSMAPSREVPHLASFCHATVLWCIATYFSWAGLLL